MLPPTRGSHSIQGGPCHTSESCSVVLGDHSPPHPSFKAGIVPAVCREHWLPLTECPWLTDILFHLHFWQRAHELLPREAQSMPSASTAFLSSSADLLGDIFQRLFFFFHLQRSLSSLDHPDRPLLHSSFPCSPRLPFSFLTAGQRGKQARNRWHRGSGGKSTPPGSRVKVRTREPQHALVVKVRPLVGPGKSWAMVLASFHGWRFHTSDRRTRETSKAVSLLLVKDENPNGHR